MAAPRVVIVGAGAAGVGAARAFVEAGVTPVILEARDRLGGRVLSQSLYQNLVSTDKRVENSVPIQLGANWVHILTDENPMFRVVQKLGLLLHTTSSDSEPGDDILMFEKRNECESSETWKQVSEDDFKKACDRYEWIRENFEEHIPQNEQLETSFDFMLVKSCAVFGDLPDTQRRCFNWFFDRIAIDLAIPLSLAASDNFLEPDTAGNSGEALIENGYHRVIQHLAEQYPLDIRYSQEVISVEYSEGGTASVHIKCRNDTVVECDYCVVTLPIGVLHAHTVEFLPSIPRTIQSLCSEVVPGLMNIVWLWYPTVFWPEGCNFLGVAHDRQDSVDFGTFLIPPLRDDKGMRQPILMCQLVGPFAEASELMSEKDVAAKATEVLRCIFGSEAVPDAAGCLRSRWKSEPFTRGSWAHVPYRGQTTTSGQKEFATESVVDGIDGRVLYAGEAENYEHRGTVHGAYMSGEEKAKIIIEKIRMSS